MGLPRHRARLHDEGARLGLRDHHGRTAFMIADNENRGEVVRVLLLRGAALAKKSPEEGGLLRAAVQPAS